MMFNLLTVVCALLGSALAVTHPPPNALVVGPDSEYTKVQQAVDHLDPKKTEHQIIFIHPGTYPERVNIPKLKSSLTIYGYSENEHMFEDNVVTIIAGHSQEEGINNDKSATVGVHTPDFFMYNVNVINSHGKGHVKNKGQAVALSANAHGNMAFYGCSFKGYQDTLMAERGYQLYVGCEIQGAVDFLFGKYAYAIFERTTFSLLDVPMGFVSANGARGEGDSKFLINNSRFVAAPGQDVMAGAYDMSRPWGAWAFVVIQNTELSDAIKPRGWSAWDDSEPHTEHCYFAEYNNFGPGSDTSKRAKFSHVLSEGYSFEQIIPDYRVWADLHFFT